MIDVLFVCYGNICRSPMAEALLDARLSELVGANHDVVVASAGVGAAAGTKATREAHETMQLRGLTLSGHAAQRVDAALVRRAKQIYVMEPSQADIVRSFVPDARVEVLAGGVEDPIGCGRWVYEAVADKIGRAIEPIARQIAMDRGAVLHDQPGSGMQTAMPAKGENVVRIALGSDHAGYRYKELFRERLEKAGHEVTDFGTDTDTTPSDYTEVSSAIARAVARGDYDRGVIVAGSGNGEAIVANKIRGVRATVCNDLYTAEMARRHNDANVLCVGQRACGEPVALAILDCWIETPFDGGRHADRIAKIAQIEAEEHGGTV